MSPARDAVLLLTHSGDHFTVERVADGVARRGLAPVRVDTDRFPTQIAITSHRGARTEAVLRVGDLAIADDRVRGVWYRRIRPPRPDSELDATFAAECAAESLAALDGLFDSLHRATWIDAPGRVRAAANKLHQLRVAADAGLRVPETVVTNQPDPVRDLYARTGGRVVAKLLRSLSVGMAAPPRAVYTSAVSASDLDDLAALASCPMVFQERITATCELRVAYVAGRCFVGGVRTPDCSEPDWRRAREGALTWTAERLDDGTESAVRRLMDRLGLTFGALDLMRTAAGEHVFLEVNPAGEWGMLERALDLPIGDAIAGALVSS